MEQSQGLEHLLRANLTLLGDERAPDEPPVRIQGGVAGPQHVHDDLISRVGWGGGGAAKDPLNMSATVPLLAASKLIELQTQNIADILEKML